MIPHDDPAPHAGRVPGDLPPASGSPSPRDPTERSASPAAPGPADELYRSLFEANPLPSWAYDLETRRFLAVNEAAVRHYGWTREEFAAMTLGDLHPLEAAAADEAPDADGELPAFHRAQHRRRDGRLLDVEITGGPVRFAGRPARIMVVQDVTERRRLEDDLHRAQKLESLGRLAGGIAHDFNNLLTAILGYTQLLETQLTDPDTVADLREIHEAGVRARDLTAQLLAVARHQLAAPRVLDLNVLAATMERLLRRVIGEHLELDTRLAPGLWPVRADPAQIEQVLMNLSLNARDAMPHGGRLTIATRNLRLASGDPAPAPGIGPGAYVLIEVADTGEGMSPETLAHVFEPFFTTKPPGQGTGLGLATVYGIVQQVGGGVSIESVPGRGTTIRIVLRRCGEPLPRHCDALDGVPPGGTESVMVVEDDTAVRTLLIRTLERAGYQVEAAVCGEDALAVSERVAAPLHLLVTDIVMPRLGGLELARHLSARHPDLRVVYVTGYAPGSPTTGPLPPGAMVLAKPFTAASLLARVREALDHPARRAV